MITYDALISTAYLIIYTVHEDAKEEQDDADEDEFADTLGNTLGPETCSSYAISKNCCKKMYNHCLIWEMRHALIGVWSSIRKCLG